MATSKTIEGQDEVLVTPNGSKNTTTIKLDDLPDYTNPEYNPDDNSVVGKLDQPSFAGIVKLTEWAEEAEEEKTLHDQLVPQKTFADYLEVPVSSAIVEDIFTEIIAFDARYELFKIHITTLRELIQFLVNFRWSRFNILDHYIRFSDYARLVTSYLSLINVPTYFPVLITGNTVLNAMPELNADLPFMVSNNGSIAYTDNYNATMVTSDDETEVKAQSLNALNFAANFQNKDFLITNNRTHLILHFKDGTTSSWKFGYFIDNVTGIRMVDDYMIVYVIANYVEHALVVDKDFKIVEDSITQIFPEDIIKLLDPKTIIFRDAFQYYVNDDHAGDYMTFPVTNMFNSRGEIVKKYTILKTTLVEPRPTVIQELAIDNSNSTARINTQYEGVYRLTWSYNKSMSLLTLYPSFGYEFDKNNFYNPRVYLQNSDYDEACIPLHGGFRRSHSLNWFFGRRGYRWTNGNWYGYFWPYFW